MILKTEPNNSFFPSPFRSLFYLTWYCSIVQAGVVETLDTLVKEFISAGSDEKKAVYGRMEEEVEKLKGSAARLNYGLYVLFGELHELHLKIGILAVVQPEI